MNYFRWMIHSVLTLFIINVWLAVNTISPDSLQNQEGKLLFITNHCTVNKLSQPEETFETVKIAWVWDYYGASTILIKQPDNDNLNTIYTIYELVQDGQVYYLSAKIGDYEYYEIILDRKNKSVEIKSLYPVQGINLKYFQE